MTRTRVRTLYTPPLAGQTATRFSPRPKKQRTGTGQRQVMQLAALPAMTSGCRQELFTCLRECHVARRPFQQGDSNVPLQLSNAPADALLRNVQTLRGTGEVQSLANVSANCEHVTPGNCRPRNVNGRMEMG